MSLFINKRDTNENNFKNGFTSNNVGTKERNKQFHLPRCLFVRVASNYASRIPPTFGNRIDVKFGFLI